MKNFWIAISIIILGLSACAPAEQAADIAIAPFIPPTAPPTTNNPTLAYFRQYVSYMQEWGTEFEHVRDLSFRLSQEGLQLLDDEAFILELSNALADFQTAAKNAAELEPPSTELQKFQDKAEELHEQSEIFTKSYMLALAGDATALETFRAALKHVTELFLEIRDGIENGNYIP